MYTLTLTTMYVNSKMSAEELDGIWCGADLGRDRARNGS
jgi:hypothetical protein